MKNSTQALDDLYRQWMQIIADNPEMTISDIRDLFEHWGDVTAEPGGIDYRLQSLENCQAMWIEPAGCQKDKVLLCAHGGGYVFGSMYSHRKLFGHFAKKTGCRALVVDFRRAPEFVHPAPVNDMVDAYSWLLDSGEVKNASDVVFIGDSAGGALAITMLLLAKERSLPMPAASIAVAAYLDMEAKSASYDRNASVDSLGSREGNLQFISVFLGQDGDPQHPLANPFYADLTGLPPILLQVGGHDVLEDDSVRFHERAKAVGVDAELEVFAEMPHVFHFLAGNAVQADDAIAKAAKFARRHLDII